MSWIKNNDNDYSKTIGKHGTLSCTRHCIFGDTWWEINYSDEYIDECRETDDDEVNHNDTEKVLKYADDWLLALIKDISNKYNKLREKDI